MKDSQSPSLRGECFEGASPTKSDIIEQRSDMIQRGRSEMLKLSSERPNTMSDLM